jgi:tetratricopeptide (TPR) repeat protein
LIDRGHLEGLYRNVRDRLKCGKLDGFQKADIQEIDKLVKAKSFTCSFPEDSLQYAFFKLQSYLHSFGDPHANPVIIGNPLYLKAISISLEFRDYLEELPYDDLHLLGTLARRFLDEFNGGTLKLSTPNDRKLLKEKARLVSTYANQLRRQHQYKEAEQAVKSATRIILTALQPKGMQCNTVLGGLFYVESKLLRDYGQYRGCEEKLTEAIKCYSSWVIDNSDNPKNIQLASYKIALFLGNIAWSKNSRGFCTDALALINAARLLILPTEWQLDKAHLDLIYADVERAFIGTNSKKLEEAISIVDCSYVTFKNHPHNRMQSRAAFASALLNFYGNNLKRAEKKLIEVERFSKKSRDIKWLVNCWTLIARIRIKQGKADDALSFLSKSIDESITAQLANQLVVAHIVKGEAHCLSGNYQDAIESFDEARKFNENRIGAGIEVSSERNKGWILLSLAQTHLLNNDVGQAKTYLERWEHLESVEFKWLHENAERIRQEVKARSSQAFTVESGTGLLNLKKHEKDLTAWLINQAKLQTGSEKNNDIANALGIGTRRLGQLKRDLNDDDDLPPPKINFPRRKKKDNT